jgi:hypothetical protein
MFTHVRTHEMAANVLTKELGGMQHDFCVKQMGIS